MIQRDPRRTLAIMTVAFGIGQIVGPTFAGVLRDATGNSLAPSLTAVGACYHGRKADTMTVRVVC